MLRRTGLALLLVVAEPCSALGQAITDDPRVASALNLLEVWLEAQRDYEDVPGLSLAVVHDQHVVWKGAYGHADRERSVPATTKTIYSICSISKLFTSIGVMQLRDQGKLHLDDPVGERSVPRRIRREPCARCDAQYFLTPVAPRGPPSPLA